MQKQKGNSMSIPADYHLHSCHSGDSEAPMRDMITQAISIGLDQMCFTEHMDMNYPYGSRLAPGTFHLDTDSYMKDFQSCRNIFDGRIGLHFGIELGLQPQIADRNSRYIRTYPFEFVIASTHVCNGKDPYYPDYYEGRSIESAIREFFECTLENVTTFHDYDVYGHLDYIVRYLPEDAAPFSVNPYFDLVDEILHRIVAEGKGLDLNTKALYSGLTEPNPCADILKRYYEIGGRILTFGSDAHSPENIARGFDSARDLALSCGFTRYCTFENRTPVFHSL